VKGLTLVVIRADHVAATHSEVLLAWIKLANQVKGRLQERAQDRSVLNDPL